MHETTPSIRSLREISSDVRQRKQQLAALPQPQMQTELLENVSSAELQVLERIFVAEINGLLPAQFKSRLLETLRKRGMVAPMTMTLPGRFSVRVDGWQLTHYGRMTYCASCPDDEQGPDRAREVRERKATVKIVYGYQQDGTFLLATVEDDSLSESVDEIKQTINAVQLEGESYVEIGRSDCQKIAKHMQFGKKGDIRIVDKDPK